jgi:hypothetical protein
LEHADELVVGDPVQPGGPDIADEPGQRHAGWQVFGDATGRLIPDRSRIVPAARAR